MGDFSARLAQARERLKKNEEKKNTSPLEDRIAQARERLKPVREETVAPQRKTALRGNPAPVPSVGKDRMVNLDDGEYGTAKGGKFYSRPTLYQDAEWMRADIMDTEGALLDAERRTGDAYAALKKAAAEMHMEPGNRLIANAYNDLLDEYKTVYGQYRTAADKYGADVGAYSDYMAEQGKQYDAWRSTVRDRDTVQGDVDSLFARIKELEDIEHDIQSFEIAMANTPADQRPVRDFGGFTSVEEVQEEIARLRGQEGALQDELWWAKAFDYGQIKEQADFGTVVNAMVDARSDGFWLDDFVPDFVQGDLDARTVVHAIQNGTLDTLQEQYGFLTEDQQNILLYYAGRGEWDKATEYLEWAERSLNQQAAAAQQKRVEEFSKENPFWASVLSPGASVLGGAMGAADLLAQNVERAFTGKPVDYNTEGLRLGSVGGQVRGTVGGMIEDATDFEIGGRNVASTVYNTAMSGADSFLSAMIPGGAVVLAANAAQSRARDLAARGATDNQALAGGLAAGVFEGLFEAVSIGNLNALKDLPVDGLKTFVLNIAKSAGVNASEEAATELANIVFDALAMGDVSDWQTSINDYIDAGKTPEEAARKTAWDMFGNVIESAASGALMGFGFGVAGSAQSAIYNSGLSVLERAAQEVAQRGTISNNTAERIMADPTAMEQLGVDTNGMTKSQTRNAVKDAVAEQNPTQEAASAVESTTAPVQQTAPQRASESETALRIQQGERASAALGENGARAFKAAYDETTAATLSAEDAYSGFARVYNAALKGETVESDLPAHMKLAAEASAKRDAALANQQNVDYTETTNGVDANGEEVYLRNGSQRDGSAYSGGQVSAVEEGAGRNQGWHPAGQFADRGASALSYGERVSTSSLGIGGGSQQNDIRLVTEGGTEYTEEAKRIAKERGLRVVFFAGNNLSIREGKDYASARGYISGDRVFIRVDHPLYTADQIMRHEVGHDMIAKGEVDVNEVRRRIKRELGRKTVKQAAKDYADAYEGSGLTADEIWEEVICDSLGDMNIFSGRENAEAVASAVLAESKKAVEATKKAPARAPPADGKMSRDGYSGDQVAWAVNNGVITESERAAFFQMIANIKKLGHKVRRTSHGGYIVDLGNKLLLTDGNWKNPSLSSVIIFNDTSETSMAVAKDVIFNGSHNKAGYDQSRQIIENAYWPGYVERYTERNSASYAREVAGREGEDGGADYEGYGDRVNTYSPDYAHWRNAMKDGKTSRDLEHGGVSVDPATESAFPVKFSRETWEKSSYVQDRENAIKSLSSALNVSRKKAAAYIDTVNSIAKKIADDRVRLDYEASPGRSAFVSNTEYGGSIDFSTICKKRRLFTGTLEAIQSALPNTALTADEVLEIRRMMAEAGYEVSCGLCYVEGSRANMGQYTKQFLDEYAKTNPAYLPNMAEMNTASGQEQIRLNHPEVYAAYEEFMNKLAQRKPKMYQMATAYQGEVLEKFGKRGSNVEGKNRNGGLRIQSFSDFEIIHLIDSMQVIVDMSQVGLAGQAYTKVPDFAWALGDTGLKINLSLIAKGVDNNGNLILDEVEGMPKRDAEALRNHYSKNVGTIVVVFNDEQLHAAMKDDFIDFIIPFHRSQWNSQQYEAMGLPKNAKDYTMWQNESYIEPVYNKNGKKQRPSNYMPNEYWDFSKSGKENAQKYLEMCHQNNRKPKFSHLLVKNSDGSYSLQPDGSTDGYWKLLIDFKMYDNDGVGSPQMPVTPDFNMEQANRMLDDYTGGHEKFPAATDIVEEFVQKYKADHDGAKFSRDIDQAKIDAAAAKNAERNAKIAGMIKQYGTIPAGENPAREVSVPRRTSDDKKVSQTVRTIMEAGATPDEALPNIEQMIADEEFSYEVYGDDKAVSEADGFVRNLGWDAAQREWFSEMGKGVVSKRNTTLGWMLYNNAVNSGKTTLAMDILNEMVKSQRNAAQALQATRILKKLSPETQLFGVQRSVANLIEDLKKRYGDKAPNLTIDQDMAERFLRAKTDKERAEAMQEIYRDIGRQMPSTFLDKFNAWRYLAMLGNTRTHVRNIMGNLGFAPVVAFKNLTAAGIERLVLRQGRTKSVAFATKEGRALLKAAWDDYTAVSDSMPDGKYSDLKNANKYIEEGRVIFTSKLGRATVERARRFNSKALSAEDAWFSRPHYASALAQYCKTNGISVEAVQKGKGVRLEAARRYAMKEAQKATYQDANAFSEFFSRLGRSRSSNKWLRRGSMLVEGVLPFRKTPANILVRSVEYSPLGLVHGIKLALWDVQRGNATAAEAIDRISAGLTGSALLGLGLWMAAAGLVRGHGDDEKEKEKNFSELQGHQAYALELPNGTSVTLDWLAPEALPFFIGVNFWEMTSGMKDAPKMEDWLRAVGNVSEPLLEMSCLQGLNSMLDSVGYASSEGLAALPTIAVSAATSLMTQVIPTLFGQIERTGEDVRMTTYTDKNKWLDSDTQYFLGKVTSKIPGIDYGQIPYIDAWGRTESNGGPFERAFNNFLNPAYMSDVNVSEMEKELERLYKATGETGVLPSRAAKSFTVNGEEINLTGEQYVEYATYRGQRAYQLITELTECRFYSALSDAEKQKAVEKCYEVANEEAKSMISEFELGIFHKHLADAEAVGISNAEYIVFYKTVNSIKGEDRAQKIRNWLKNSGFTRQQKEFLWSTEYKGAY